MPGGLQGARFLPMPLDLCKGDSAARQENQAVGHSVQTGADEFGADTARFFDRQNEPVVPPPRIVPSGELVEMVQ